MVLPYAGRHKGVLDMVKTVRSQRGSNIVEYLPGLIGVVVVLLVLARKHLRPAHILLLPPVGLFGLAWKIGKGDLPPYVWGILGLVTFCCLTLFREATRKLKKDTRSHTTTPIPRSYRSAGDNALLVTMVVAVLLVSTIAVLAIVLPATSLLKAW